MGASSKSFAIAVAIPFLAAVLTTACDRPAAPPADVEEPAAPTTLAAAELAPTLAPANEYREAVRREQRQLDAQLQLALEGIDRKLGTRPQERPQLLRTRQRLAADQRLVAKSDERGWDELKAEVERDLVTEE